MNAVVKLKGSQLKSHISAIFLDNVRMRQLHQASMLERAMATSLAGRQQCPMQRIKSSEDGMWVLEQVGKQGLLAVGSPEGRPPAILDLLFQRFSGIIRILSSKSRVSSIGSPVVASTSFSFALSSSCRSILLPFFYVDRPVAAVKAV